MKNLFIRFFLFYFVLSPLWASNLIIATIANAPPFEFQNDAKGLSGFDIDLMNDLCKRMNTRCKFKIYEFSQVLPALKRGEVDLAIAAIDITPQRKEQFLFSLPYKLANIKIVTLTTSDLQTPNQLVNKHIGFYKNAPDKDYLNALSLQQIHAQYYPHVADLFAALKQKEVDAIVVEPSRAAYWLANNQGFKVLGKSVSVAEGYGIAANLNQNELIEEINHYLKQMERDGTYLQIYNRYFK